MFDTTSLNTLARDGKVCGTCYEPGHVYHEVTPTMRPITVVVDYLSQGDGALNVKEPLNRDEVRALATIQHLPDGGQELRVPIDFYDRL